MVKPTSRIASVCNEIGTGHMGTVTFAAAAMKSAPTSTSATFFSVP